MEQEKYVTESTLEEHKRIIEEIKGKPIYAIDVINAALLNNDFDCAVVVFCCGEVDVVKARDISQASNPQEIEREDTDKEIEDSMAVTVGFKTGCAGRFSFKLYGYTWSENQQSMQDIADRMIEKLKEANIDFDILPKEMIPKGGVKKDVNPEE